MTNAPDLRKYAKLSFRYTDFKEPCSDPPAYNFLRGLLNV